VSKQQIEVVDSLSTVEKTEWDRLAGGNPFLRYDFLHTLHTTGCAQRRTGWIPHFLLLRREKILVGAMPLYLKTHSRGEYVFDYAWAEAYSRNGMPYYPKLVSAVPFTAVTGARVLAASTDDKTILAQAAVELAAQLEVSSLHVLFPDSVDANALREAGFMMREGVQFHWKNDSYGSFDAFLATMNKDKRKKIKQDRRHVAEAGVTFRRLRGSEITEADLDFFYQCYATTYDNHYSSPYLTPGFFRELLQAMPESLLLVLAQQEGRRVASALNFIGGDAMYGRYWGTTHFISGLHFETCYMQAIEYCIENGLAVFEGGAQGEHKLARGLLPTATWSAHWVADRRFAEAIGEFLAAETAGMDHYIDELEAHAPFRKSS
jgi:predicted N-acyltransferase